MRKKLPLFLLLLLPSFLPAQTVSFEKLYSHDVITNDALAGNTNLSNASKSHTVIAGNAQVGTLGDQKIVMVKVDKNGTTVNRRVMGMQTGYHDVSVDMMLVQDDSYYLTGYTRNIDTSGSPLFTSFLIKLDTNLNPQWQRNYIMPGNDMVVKAMNETSDGHFLIAGVNYDFALSNWYTFVMKTDLMGNVVWCKTFLAFYSMDAVSVQELLNGDILLAGSTAHGPWLVMPTAVRLDSLGDFIWGNVYDYDIIWQQNSLMQFAKELPSGNLLLGGRSDYYASTNGNMDYRLMKTGSDGQPLWSRSYGENQIDWPYGVTFDNVQNMMVFTGSTGSYHPFSYYGQYLSVDTTGSVVESYTVGDTNVQLNIALYNYAKLNSIGYILSGTYASNSGTPYLYATLQPYNHMLEASCHTYPVTPMVHTGVNPDSSFTVITAPAQVDTNSILFDHTETVNDSLLCLIEYPLSTEDPASAGSISIHPNPSQETVYMNFPVGMVLKSYKLYNLSGQLVMSGNQTQLNISGLAAGMYTLSVLYETKEHVMKTGSYKIIRD